METDLDKLDFVTIEGLLAYGEALASRTAGSEIVLPPQPPPSADRPRRAHDAMARIRALVQRAQAGFPDAEGYRAARRAVIEDGCGGDELVWYAAWNRLLAEGELSPLFRAPIGKVQKPTHRRPVAIVPRTVVAFRSVTCWSGVWLRNIEIEPVGKLGSTTSLTRTCTALLARTTNASPTTPVPHTGPTPPPLRRCS